MRPVLGRILYPVLALSFFALSLALLFWQASLSDWHDFDVFYGGASAALAGRSIYIIVGKYNLPFWYPPWTAWFFIPFAVWPRNIGLLLYQAAMAISAILVIRHLTRYYDPGFNFLNQLVIVAVLIPMSIELVVVGQMDYIFLGLTVLLIWLADRRHPIWAGVLFPLLLTKPHLIIPFTLFLFWRLGKRGLIAAGLTTLAMLVIATILSPGWYLDMLHLIGLTGGRTAGLAFTTLPSLLGGRENWIGTGNLLFTVVLIIAAILLLWRFRTLPTIPFLSLALALSLFGAPRAYAYDLPLLIPALAWLTAGRFRSTVWIWIVAGLWPQAVGFSSLAYLDVLLVCALGIRKAALETSTIPKALPA